MLRMNLATRPFYNERLVHVVLAALAILACGILVTGGLRVTALMSERASLTASAARDEERALEIAANTIQLQREATGGELEVLAAATVEANRLIDQRTFSWTEFLNLIEATLPPDVMLTSLRPNVDANGFGVLIGIVVRSVEAIDQFIEALEATGAFADVLSREEEIADDGSYRAVLFGRYQQHAGDGVAHSDPTLLKELAQ